MLSGKETRTARPRCFVVRNVARIIRRNPMKQIRYTPIGTIRSPFTDPKGMPIQPRGAKGVKGTIELKAKYAKGLKGIRGLSHVILLYHFHRTTRCSLEVTPFLDKRPHGIFATRAPERPNPIGISVVRLTGVKGRVLWIEDVDILDGTPLLDIKPYVPIFDRYNPDRLGWFAKIARRSWPVTWVSAGSG